MSGAVAGPGSGAGLRNTQRPEQLVGVQARRSEHFGQAAATKTSYVIELPQTVLGMNKTEPEYRIGLVSGTNVRHTVAIPHNLKPGFQPSHSFNHYRLSRSGLCRGAGQNTRSRYTNPLENHNFSFSELMGISF